MSEGTTTARRTPDELVDARLRRLMMVLRQGCYFIADELGKEYGLERPCKRCERERRTIEQRTANATNGGSP